MVSIILKNGLLKHTYIQQKVPNKFEASINTDDCFPDHFPIRTTCRANFFKPTHAITSQAANYIILLLFFFIFIFFYFLQLRLTAVPLKRRTDVSALELCLVLSPPHFISALN